MSATTTLRKIEDIQDFEAINTTTVIVTHNYHLQEIVSLANRYKFMAIDCEWVPRSVIEIALLQFSFPNGKCFLVRGYQVNQGILNILTNPEIIKIGVAILEQDKDYGRIKSRWNINPRGLVDIRHFVKEDVNYPHHTGRYGLETLAEYYLNEPNFKHGFQHNQHWDWEDYPLPEENVCYAANDVYAVMAICLKTVLKCHPTSYFNLDFNYLVQLARNYSMQWIDKEFDRFSQSSNFQRYTLESAIARPQSSVGRPMHNLHFDDDDDNEQGNQSGGSGLSGLAIGTGIGKEDPILNQSMGTVICLKLGNIVFETCSVLLFIYLLSFCFPYCSYFSWIGTFT